VQAAASLRLTFFFSEVGACGPIAVKAKPFGRKPGDRGSSGFASVRPHHPPVSDLDRIPPLIGAGLVGCMRNR